MDDASLGSVVSRLQLGDIDNVSAHACCSNEAAIGIILKFLSIDISSLLFLPSPVDTSSSGTIERAV